MSAYVQLQLVSADSALELSELVKANDISFTNETPTLQREDVSFVTIVGGSDESSYSYGNPLLDMLLVPTLTLKDVA